MAKRASAKTRRAKAIRDPNDFYFATHFTTLVRKHGGKWIVLTEGKLVGIGDREDIPVLMQKARELSPMATPFLAPIPRPEELECVL